MKKESVREVLSAYGLSLFGVLLFSLGFNLLIVPLGLYSGGFIGIAQLIRTFLADFVHMNFFRVHDVTGVLYFIINVPLFLLAWKEMGRGFFKRTIITVAAQTLFLTIVPIPKEPIISDMLTSCLIGGIIAGTGTGLVLRASSSSGGQDILGVYCAKKYPNFSVGKLSIALNAVIYSICLFIFNVEVAVYSLIYTVFLSFMIDKVHYQNINMSVMIFTKKEGISRAIIDSLGRGVTNWDGCGAYTNEKTNVLVTVISKYEVNRLKRIVHKIDPTAFMIFNEGMGVTGNFEKRL